METYQLFHFDFCPFCMRVRQFLELKGIDMPLRNIHREPEALRELLAGGGSQQVPCLRIAVGDQVRWLYESADILEYLHSRLLAQPDAL